MVLQPVSEREQEIGNPGQRGLLMLERDIMTDGPTATVHRGLIVFPTRSVEVFL